MKTRICYFYFCVDVAQHFSKLYQFISYSNVLLTSQVIGGFLADKFGGKHVIGFGLLVSIIANMLIPVCARINPYIVIGLRVIIGMASVGIQHVIF